MTFDDWWREVGWRIYESLPYGSPNRDAQLEVGRRAWNAATREAIFVCDEVLKDSMHAEDVKNTLMKKLESKNIANLKKARK